MTVESELKDSFADVDGELPKKLIATCKLILDEFTISASDLASKWDAYKYANKVEGDKGDRTCHLVFPFDLALARCIGHPFPATFPPTPYLPLSSDGQAAGEHPRATEGESR